MQISATKYVDCPYCAEESNVRVSDEDIELKVSRSVAAFGEYATVTCSNDHDYWVYFC